MRYSVYSLLSWLFNSEWITHLDKLNLVKLDYGLRLKPIFATASNNDAHCKSGKKWLNFEANLVFLDSVVLSDFLLADPKIQILYHGPQKWSTSDKGRITLYHCISARLRASWQLDSWHLETSNLGSWHILNLDDNIFRT